MNETSIPNLVNFVMERHSLNKRWLSKLLGCSPSTVGRMLEGTVPRGQLLLNLQVLKSETKANVRKRVEAIKATELREAS